MVKRTTQMRMKQVTLCLKSFGNKQQLVKKLFH